MEVAAELREAYPPRRGLWHHALTRLVRQPVTLTAVVILLAILLAGVLAPVIAPHGWNVIDLSDRWRNHGPTVAGWHLLGTDNIGRDTLVRTLYGLRTSMQTALFAALGGTVIGVVVAGLRRLTRRLARCRSDARASCVPGSSRCRRRSSSRLRALGASELRVFFRHVLPNLAGTIVVAATALAGQVLALEATIEFFSLRVPSNSNPTLGNLIADVVAYGIGPYQQEALGWWTWATPAAVLVLVLLCLNLIGDGLDAALNPQQVRR